jgi:hypothetical protein
MRARVCREWGLRPCPAHLLQAAGLQLGARLAQVCRPLVSLRSGALGSQLSTALNVGRHLRVRVLVEGLACAGCLGDRWLHVASWRPRRQSPCRQATWRRLHWTMRTAAAIRTSADRSPSCCLRLSREEASWPRSAVAAASWLLSEAICASFSAAACCARCAASRSLRLSCKWWVNVGALRWRCARACNPLTAAKCTTLHVMARRAPTT